MAAPSSAQSQKGPYMDQARFILRTDENLALEEVKSGALDIYFFRIPLEAADDAKNDPLLKVYERSAGSMGFFVNPAPSSDSKFNPFASREIRYALNYLMDREFMVQEILRGYGAPMYEAFGPGSPEYLNIIDVVESFGFRYNPALAESIISREMIAGGATMSGGKWTFNGSPVTISIVIRQDDSARKSMGELMSSELEKIGFTVQRDFGDLNKANALVYGSDPGDLQWHMYTEGFAGTAAFVQYNPVIPAQMYAPWYTRMPGAMNTDFWIYENSTLDDISQRILFFNFTSEQERNDLVRSAVAMGIQESVRLFVAQKTDPYVASADLEGLINDFGAGITSKYALANVRHSGGDREIDIGVKQIHQGSWNIIAGLQDTYSRDIFSSVADSGSFRHPYTGVAIPMRAEWTDVRTEGPLGTLQVEAEAVEWDPASQQWSPVDQATESVSSVAFTPLYSNWHHGVPMDISDLMYSQYFTYEWGTDLGENDLTVDPEFTAQAQVALQYLKGTKFSPGEIVSYFDIWHYDETEIADSGVFWASEPWELTAAAERLVVDGQLAFSRSASTSKGIAWYDPIVQDHAEMIMAELQEMKSENFVPAPLIDVVTPEDAVRRYDAAISWIQSRGHAVISNGGYYFDNFNSAGGTITIKAFRDPTYPFETGRWSDFEDLKLARIGNVNLPRSVAIGQPASVTVDVSVGGEPSSDADVIYFISDKNGLPVTRGDAQPAGTGQFRFDLTAEESQKLSVGPNQLKIFARPKDVGRHDMAARTLLATSAASSNNQTSNNTGGSSTPDAPSGCLIATAAFGSELTPQVQFLRNFREHYILSTASGSAFMNTFNAAYYSFSPQVADYERDQPWLQSIVKTGLYPLFGILTLSERAHFVVGGGEAGAISSGVIAGSLIGAVYLWPAALSKSLQSRFGLVSKILLVLLSASLALTIAGTIAGSMEMLSITTPILVLAVAATGALVMGKLARSARGWISNSRL
jgi:peptide/nickel transport system substrate-binding protein